MTIMHSKRMANDKTNKQHHSPSQINPTASFSSLWSLLELSVIQSYMFEEFAWQSTVLGKKSPEPWLNFSVFPLFPHFSCLQTLLELSSVHPLVLTCFHPPSYWISTLPAHLPGPSINLTSRLSVPWQQKDAKPWGTYTIKNFYL